MHGVAYTWRLAYKGHHVNANAFSRPIIIYLLRQMAAQIKLECGPMPNVMALLPNILLNATAWLMHTTQVPCSNAANIGKCNTWTHSEFYTWQNSVRGQEPPKMYIPAQEMAKHSVKFG